MVARRAGVCVGHLLVLLLMPRKPASVEGKTLPSRHQEPEPRLPHEHDESRDSHPGTEDERVKQAAQDVASGQKDTGRSPVVTELARTHFPSKDEKKEKRR